jgi:hypothetical protein
MRDANDAPSEEIEVLLLEIEAGLARNEQLRLKLHSHTAEGRKRMARCRNTLTRLRAKLDPASNLEPANPRQWVGQTLSDLRDPARH